jgi:lipopolysaccharide biosynthesis glycosyltransferase
VFAASCAREQSVQDILHMLCEDRVYSLPLSWNFCNDVKTSYVNIPYTEIFWKNAIKTPFFSEIISKIIQQKVSEEINLRLRGILKGMLKSAVKNRVKRFVNIFFPPGTLRRRCIKKLYSLIRLK